jgi:hypothetical protein
MHRIVFSTFLFFLAAIAIASADMKVKTRMTTSGQGMESTQYVKGARQRTEMQMGPGMNIVNIYQCDQERMVMVNEKLNRCMVIDLKEDESATPTEQTPASNSQRPARSSRSGGVVTITTGATDTGERKDFFGYKARRIKTNMSMESSPGACADGSMAMDSDGWYIDFPQQNLACTTSPRAQMSMNPNKPECRDQYKFKRTGNARLGYPVSVETRINPGKGQPMTTRVEALELSKATLDDKLFDMPPGCTVVGDYMALMGLGSVGDIMRQAQSIESAPTRPTRESRGGAGKIRIGLVQFGNNARANVQTAALRMKLKGEIDQFEFEGVELNVAPNAKPEEAERAAQEAGCQYFAYTDITSMKDPSGGKKLGGFLARATGVDSSASMGKYESAIQYRLYEVSEPEEPKLQPELTQTSNSLEGTSADDSVSRAVEHEAGEIVVQVRTDLERKRRGVK